MVALLLSAVTVLAALAAAFLLPTAVRITAAALALAALIGGALQRYANDAVQIRVTEEGDIVVRRTTFAEAQPMRVLFCAPWLIVLGAPAAVRAVWPDALGPNEFRRLAVASRWHRPART